MSVRHTSGGSAGAGSGAGPDRFAELAPLAALGALDGEDREAFDVHVRGCASCGSERRAYEEIAARLPLALEAVPAAPGVRARLLAALDPRPAAGVTAAERSGARGLSRAAGAAGPRFAPWLAGLAAAAALVLGVGLLVVVGQRDAARRETVVARAEAQAARRAASVAAERLDALRSELAQLDAALHHERRLRELLSHAESRVARLDGLPPAPSARARVVWNPARREALLVAAGLQPAPAGKAYEVWVIGAAGSAPVPAGVFQVEADGLALFRFAGAGARAHTVAITLEPAEGVPAPTGPMVLAGSLS